MQQNELNNSYKFYTEKLKALHQSLKHLNAVRNRIAWLRFITVLATICAAYFLWNEKWYVATFVIASGIGIFLRFVFVAIENNYRIANINALININEEELKILDEKYAHREDGIGFQQEHHAYADDMDIFGNNSLFQYINRCNSEQGKNLLAQQLLSHQNKEHIQLQQEAVKELTTKVLWYRQLQGDL